MPRRSIRWIPALLGLSVVSLVRNAAAEPPRQPGALDGGAYVHVSPGPVAAVLSEHKFSSEARWAWPWSLGAGWMFTRGPVFKATVGGAFEHRVLMLDSATPHSFHALAESRIGAGNNRVWGYGLVGVGAGALFVNPGKRRWSDFYGVVAQFGGGVQGLAGRRFFVGGELDFDIGYYFSVYQDLEIWDQFYYQTVTAELVIGWYF